MCIYIHRISYDRCGTGNEGGRILLHPRDISTHRSILDALAIEIKETLGSRSIHKLVQAAPLAADKGIRASASSVRMDESHS